MKLYDEYEELHDKFQILAFHDTRAKDFEDLDEKLASVVKDRWNGREFRCLRRVSRRTSTGWQSTVRTDLPSWRQSP